MSSSFHDLNQRSLEIFRELVATYMETGDPVGSRTLSKRIKETLSPATVRNIMADLEDSGLLYSPHTSAGRLPTPEGLKFFIHGLLEIGSISEEEKHHIEASCKNPTQNVANVLEHMTTLLSGLSKCTSLVMSPKKDAPLKHIEFVHLSSNRALVILVSEDGGVENRLIEIPENVSGASLSQAAHYLNQRLSGSTLGQAKGLIHQDLQLHRAHLDELTTKIVEAGLAVWSGDAERGGGLIVKGQSHLLDTVTEASDLEHIRKLFQILETKEALAGLLEASIQGDGIQIFIGSENHLFELSGCSVVVSPYRNAQHQIVGAIGVLGPSRMNYGKIIPLVDYTAKMMERLLG